MSVVIWALLAVLLIFFIIIGSRIVVKAKAKSKAPKEEKPKEKKEKKVKEPKPPKEKKEKKGKPKKEKHKNEFIRPSDIAWAELREKQKREAELKAQKEAEEAKRNGLAEGESDNPNFTEPDDDWNMDDEKPEPTPTQKPDGTGLTTEKTSEMAEEIKNLSPEMKALLFGDVLDKKTK